MSPFTRPRTGALLLLPNHIRFPRIKRTTFAVRKQPHPVLQQISPAHQVWKRSLWNVVNSLALSHYYWNANSSQQKWKGEDHVFSCVSSILPSLITLPGGLVLWKVFMMCTLPCITLVYCAQHRAPKHGYHLSLSSKENMGCQPWAAPTGPFRKARPSFQAILPSPPSELVGRIDHGQEC